MSPVNIVTNSSIACVLILIILEVLYENNIVMKTIDFTVLILIILEVLYEILKICG